MMKSGHASPESTSRMISTSFFPQPTPFTTQGRLPRAYGGVMMSGSTVSQGCEGLGCAGNSAIGGCGCSNKKYNNRKEELPSSTSPTKCQYEAGLLKTPPLGIGGSSPRRLSCWAGVADYIQRFDLKLMQAQVLVERISQTVDELGRLLDQIYKFPQRQREQYFQKIQTLKNGLLSLKTNLKESNLAASEKQYRQIYLAANALRSEVATHCALHSNKENRDVNRRDKEGRKNHDDAMKLIVERDEHIEELKGELFQKEELIRINYDELRQYKRDNQKLAEDNRYVKYQLAELQVNYAAVSGSYNQLEGEMMDLKIRHQELERDYRLAEEEVEAVKRELIEAYEKLEYYEQLAEISIKKTRAVEENIRRIENDAKELNDNYRMKESQSLRKEKEKAELEETLSRHIRVINELQQDNQSLRKDLETHEKEMVQLQRAIYDQRATTHEERDKYGVEIGRAERERDFYRKQSEKTGEQLQEMERKYEEVLNRINEVEQQSEQHLQQKNQLEVELSRRSDRIQQLESELERTKKECQLLGEEKQKLAEQVDKYVVFNRALEADVLKAKEKGRSKDDERIRLTRQLEETHQQLRQQERALAQTNANEQVLHAQLHDLKAQLVRSEERYNHRQREINTLRTRLLHAKIETLHEIREELSP